MKLDKFIGMMTGHFDNKEQFDMMQKAGKIYPYAEHINTICNDKIKNIPKDFNGKFVVEESYYETNGKIAGIRESRSEPTDTGEHIQIFDFQMILHHIPPIPKSSEKVRT